MNWFKKETSKTFDFGEPSFNLRINMPELKQYDPIDVFYALRDDLIIKLKGKEFTFNQILAYTVGQNLFNRNLSLSTKGYLMNQSIEGLPYQDWIFVFSDSTNIDGLIDWNKLFRIVIAESQETTEHYIKHLGFLLQGNFEGFTIHSHRLPDYEIMTFEIDTEHDNRIRIRELYEQTLNEKEYDQYRKKIRKTGGKLIKKYTT